MLGHHHPHDACHFVSREAGVDSTPVSFDALSLLRKEPLEESACAPELAPDDRAANRQCPLTGGLTKKLAASVQIEGIGWIILRVVACASAEHAIRAEVDQPGASGLAE